MTAEPDARLGALHEAAERISANLVELELDSSRQLLEASALQGESAARWSAANAQLTELWRRHGLLEELLQRADELQSASRAGELRSLVQGASIELASTDVPLAERSLLGTAQETQRCTPDALLKSMSAAFDEVKLVVSAIGQAWEALIPRLDAGRRIGHESVGLADEVGESGRRDLRAAEAELDRLQKSVTTDPLSVGPAEIEAAVRSLQAIHDELEETVALKRAFEARTLEARELLEHLHDIVRQARAAHDEAQLKISVPSAPPANLAPDELAAELDRIADLAGDGAWREARRGLQDWTARTQVRLEDARRTLAANRAPIEARNQFRALLEAYQVKAKRLGRLEDAELLAISARAHEALYTAPADLALAAQLVRRYQQVLSGSQEALS
jgi:hypothetical protein